MTTRQQSLDEQTLVGFDHQEPPEHTRVGEINCYDAGGWQREIGEACHCDFATWPDGFHRDRRVDAINVVHNERLIDR